MTFENGKTMCVQVTKKGGYILTISCYAQYVPEYRAAQKCEKLVEKFVNDLGFEDLKAIWATKLDGNTIINLAPIINDVIIYPDLLKVTVNCSTDDILNIETRSYTDEKPEIDKSYLLPQLSLEEAETRINEKYKVLSGRLALIECKDGKLTLCYEFKTEIDGYIYYFYVNAKTGKIEQVIQTGETI